MKRSMKKGLAMLLSAAMLASSGGLSGLTSLAEVITDGDLNSDYYLVTLDAGTGEKFSHPSVYDTVKVNVEDEDPGLSDATPQQLSKATPSQITKRVIKKTDKAANTTQFAVVDSKELSLSEINMAAKDAGLENFEDVLWLTTKGDLNSAVIGEKNLSLTGNTTLYALYSVQADTSGCTEMQGGAVTSFSEKDVKLVVTDVAEADKLDKEEELKNAVEEAKVKNATGLDPDALLQMDISPAASSDYTGGKVTIRVNLPWEFANKMNNGFGKDIFGLHKHGGKWEEIKVTKIKDDNSSYVSNVEFTLDSFSPVVLGIKDAEPVMVTLENVPGGAAIVYTGKWDPEREISEQILVPVGKTVPVPSGIELYFDYQAFYDGSGDRITAEVDIKEAGTGEIISLDLSSGRNVSYPVDAEKGDITITPKFKAETVEEKDEPRIVWTSRTLKDSVFTGSLKVRLKERRVDGTNWKMVDDGSSDLNNDLFNLSADGSVSSKEKLETGIYRIAVSCEYNGKTLRRKFDIQVGTQVRYELSLAKYKYEGEDNYGRVSQYMGESEFFTGEKNFEQLCENAHFSEHVEYSFFGDYDIVKWYDEKDAKMSGTIKDTGDGMIFAYAKCRDTKTGEIWEPEIKKLASSDDNKDPDDGKNPSNPSRPSTGGSSSSSSSSEGYSDRYRYANELSGTWNKDEKGWWLKLRSGGYAKDTWGTVNGLWYYFGSDGYMKTGWLLWNGGWYYLNPEEGNTQGQMKTGWVFDKTLNGWFYLDKDGKMGTGWQQIGGEWYYFNPVSDGTKGAMMTNQWIGNYFVGASGAWERSKSK